MLIYFTTLPFWGPLETQELELSRSLTLALVPISPLPRVDGATRWSLRFSVLEVAGATVSTVGPLLQKKLFIVKIRYSDGKKEPGFSLFPQEPLQKTCVLISGAPSDCHS